MNSNPQAIHIEGRSYGDNKYQVIESTRRLIDEIDLLDHGVDHAQYFPGCGTAFTKFDACFIGCGDTFAEAIDDALEQLAMDGFDAEVAESMLKDDNGIDGEWPSDLGAHDNCEPEHDEDCEPDCDEMHGHDMCELYYYVSIRVKE